MRVGLAWLSLLCVFFGCSSERSLYEQRASRAERAKGEILIGAAAPRTGDTAPLREGIELALDEIRASGGINGREVRVAWRDDKATIDAARKIAHEFVQNLDMVAVIGHYYSYVSSSVSLLYEHGGLLMLNPASTAPSLTQKGARLVFRNVPTDSEIGKQLADFVYSQGYRRLIIYYVRNEYGLELSSAFEKQSIKNGIRSVDRKSYDPAGEQNLFRMDMETWKNYYNFDAIFIAGTLPEAAKIISIAREIGLNEPIVGGDGLDEKKLFDIAGHYAEGVMFATLFHPNETDPQAQCFTRLYKEKYGKNPDSNAAKGYDAMKLLAYAITKAGSTRPDKVAAVLRSTRDWPGATGLHSFDDNGDVVDKEIHIVRVRDGVPVLLK